MKTMMQKLLTAAAIGAAAIGFATTSVAAGGEQQVLVNQSVTTLSNFMRDPEMTWLQQNIGRAKAVLISPEIVKAGFIVGGSGGRGVLVAKTPDGKWVGPGFYTLATASIGFQAGLAASEVVTLVMTEKGLNSLLATSVKLGGDASIAAGGVLDDQLCGATQNPAFGVDFLNGQFHAAQLVFAGYRVGSRQRIIYAKFHRLLARCHNYARRHKCRRSCRRGHFQHCAAVY